MSCDERAEIFYDLGKVSYRVEWEKVFYTVQHKYKVKLDEEPTITPDVHDNDQDEMSYSERTEIFYDPGNVSYWVEWEKVFYTIQHIYKVKLN